MYFANELGDLATILRYQQPKEPKHPMSMKDIELGADCYLESVEGAVVLDQEVLLLADGEVVAELAEQVGQVDSLYCYKH